MAQKFVFVPPPEAPVFRPNEEEFKDPMAYIAKISDAGMRCGICKVIPPKSWNPPFAVNIKEFSFTPRIQRLYELEATSRVKLNFISRLYEFIRVQGGDKIRVPSIGGRFLDLYNLQKNVKNLGGYEKICEQNLWPDIAEALGYHSRHTNAVKSAYEKLLLNFDRIMQTSDECKENPRSIRNACLKRRSSIGADNKSDLTETPIPTRRKRKNELKNLQFSGPGPKIAVASEEPRTRARKEVEIINIDDFKCRVCGRGDDEENLLVCDTVKCHNCCHLQCSDPPLSAMPKFAWKCPECIRALCSRLPDPYGFPQSGTKYSLHEFGVMADNFKSNYFNRPCAEVPCSVVEQEFWRIVQEYNDDVVVEYGADIHSSSQGSGFPTEARLQNLVGTAQQLENAKTYSVDPWNLNVLPLLSRSVLRFIKGNIDGMKVPWCYVGMVFSTFCWHIEDHWSYSINFNHWGEPKTWYGVSRLYAEDFERAMRKHVPELFDQSPDLLHHITTNMNPNILQNEGVPVYRIDQHCGEFVITFPRAYHSGFNQGFNFAEAVNICPPDWLPIGRACVDHYAAIKRYCVFSNDELLCTLAEVAVGRCQPESVLLSTNPYKPPRTDKPLSKNIQDYSKPRLPPGCSTAGLDISAIAIVQQELKIVLAQEKRLRAKVQKAGVKQLEQIKFHLLPDDTRVCDVCMTTLFLSAVACPCFIQPTMRTKSREKRKSAGTSVSAEQDSDESYDEKPREPSHMVCLRHLDGICDRHGAATCTLKYHYSIEELTELEQQLSQCLEGYSSWHNWLNSVLKPAEGSVVQAHTTSNNSSQIKKEPTDFGPSESSSRACEIRQTVTLEELKTKLDFGRSAGYQTDDLFVEAERLVNRATELVHICTLLKPVISGSVQTSFEEASSPRMVQFQFRSPVNLSSSSAHPKSNKTDLMFVITRCEVDVNRPREADLTCLVEACKQLNPINVMEEPDVEAVTNLVSRLSDWRQRTYEVIEVVRQLSPSGASINLSSPTSRIATDGPQTSAEQSGSLEKDIQISTLLSETLQELQKDYPNFVSNVLEWKTLDLLHRTIEWLCVYQTHENDPELQWSLPDLRKHVTCGENVLGELNQCNSAGLVVTSSVISSQGNSSPNSPVAPIFRLWRPRIHTALGQLSQRVVEVDGLVNTLVELIDPATKYAGILFPYSDTRAVLRQLHERKIGHLVGKTSYLPDISTSERSDPANDSKLESSAPVLRLRELVNQVLQHSLESVNQAGSEPVCQRPQLTEMEVIMDLCLLFGSLPNSKESARTSYKSRPTTSERMLTKCMDRLDRSISATRCACQILSKEILGIETGGEDLIKSLIPHFLDGKQEEAFMRYMDASQRPPDALIVYENLADQTEQVVINAAQSALASGSFCSMCAQNLSLPEPDSDKVGLMECPLCPVNKRSSESPPLSLLEQLAEQWTPHANGNNAVLLSTPEAVALFSLLQSVGKWMDKLGGLFNSHAEIIMTQSKRLDQSLIGALPPPLEAIMKTILLSAAPTSLRSECDRDSEEDSLSISFIYQLRLTLCTGLNLPVNMHSTLQFIKHLCDLLSSPKEQS
ncbi:unnamed protein product [Calicophoron daubneyi]|uniref:[histone H3]-trimethyl-L-lysine(4) demethylase n=1 Tax=Calicophoron daubneyi TaxID=300641 RepID=A0AAV2TAQ6_CALDB